MRSLATFYLYRGDMDKTEAIGTKLLHLAEKENDTQLEVEGHLILGPALTFIVMLGRLVRPLGLLILAYGYAKFRSLPWYVLVLAVLFLHLVLGFVGLKMIVEEPLTPYLEAHGISRGSLIVLSLAVVAVILSASVVMSLLAGPKVPLEQPPTEPREAATR